jgi:hypothetical protein
MVTITLLSSSVVMGLLLTIVVWGVVRTRRREPYAPGRKGGADADFDALLARIERLADSQIAWTVGFVALVVVVGAAVIAVLGGWAIPPSAVAAAGVGLAVVFGSLLGWFLFLAVYRAARTKGLHGPMATAVGLWVFGLLFVLGVSIHLLTAG